MKSGDVRDDPIIDAKYAFFSPVLDWILTTNLFQSYLATESDTNVIIRGGRFLLNMTRREPLASKLDLKTLTHGTETDFFWPGDADPEKVNISFSYVAGD